MTEQEYINATSLAQIRASLHMMLGVETTEDEMHNSYLRKVRHSLRRLEDMYDEIVIIEESE